jgi:hypothetical protein
MQLCKNISHIQVLVTNFFPTPLVYIYTNLSVFIELFQSSLQGSQESVQFVWVPVVLQVDSLDFDSWTSSNFSSRGHTYLGLVEML